MAMGITTTRDLGTAVRRIRKALGVTQEQLALTSGTNRRAIIEIEKGKPTSQVGKVLLVLQTLGAKLDVVPPPGASLGDRGAGQVSRDGQDT